MENSEQQNLLRWKIIFILAKFSSLLTRFLADQEKLTEQRLQKLNSILETNISVPDHILDTLHHLR